MPSIMPQELVDRLNARPRPCAIRIGNKYYCQLHCPVHEGYQGPPYQDITRAQWNHYVRTGQIKHHDVELDDDGSCGQCDYYMGQMELDRRENEAERAMEEYYEEQGDA